MAEDKESTPPNGRVINAADRFIDKQIKDAKPDFDPEAEEWLNSERGQQTFQKIVDALAQDHKNKPKLKVVPNPEPKSKPPES